MRTLTSLISLLLLCIACSGFRIYIDGWRRFRLRGDDGSSPAAAAGNAAENLKFLRQAGEGQGLKTRAAENAAEIKRFMASPDAGAMSYV